jgi:hypothetical protein
MLDPVAIARNYVELQRRMLDNIGIRISVVDAYKNYTYQKNWTRPRGHKISWRKLSRLQKQCAVLNAILEA